MQRKTIDVREYPEFAQAHMEHATLVPLGSLVRASAGWAKDDALTLVCKSGRRAEQARQMLATQGFNDLTVLEGGMDAWMAAGNIARSSASRPWAMERQVRIAAGSLVVVTLALGWLASPYFMLGTAFIGAGLVFAGVSNTCMMASVLGRMPWNRAPEGRA